MAAAVRSYLWDTDHFVTQGECLKLKLKLPILSIKSANSMSAKPAPATSESGQHELCKEPHLQGFC